MNGIEIETISMMLFIHIQSMEGTHVFVKFKNIPE